CAACWPTPSAWRGWRASATGEPRPEVAVAMGRVPGPAAHRMSGADPAIRAADTRAAPAIAIGEGGFRLGSPPYPCPSRIRNRPLPASPAGSRRLLLLLVLWFASLAPALADDGVLVLGRISDDPKAHYEQLKPLLDYVVPRMADVGIREGRVLMARDAQQMQS